MNKISLKTILLNKVINKNRIKKNILSYRREKEYMKKYLPYLIGVLIIGVLGGIYYWQHSNKKTSTINYREYLVANKNLIEEKENIKENHKVLDKKLANNLINEKDYHNEKELLNQKSKNINQKILQLKKDYNITDNMNLKKVKFSDDPVLDKKYKDYYLKELVLDKAEDELDKQEEELEKSYRDGKIKKEEFITQKVKLELKEDELDQIEDELDKQEDEFDKLEDEIEKEKDRLEDEEDREELIND